MDIAQQIHFFRLGRDGVLLYAHDLILLEVLKNDLNMIKKSVNWLILQAIFEIKVKEVK